MNCVLLARATGQTVGAFHETRKMQEEQIQGIRHSDLSISGLSSHEKPK